MKKILLLSICLMSAIMMQADTFKFTTPEGYSFFCRITDAVNKKVEIDQDPSLDIYSTESVPHIAHVHIPGTVTHNGDVYTVTKINQFGIALINTDTLTFGDDIDMGWQPILGGSKGKIKNLYFPKNLTIVPNNFGWYMSYVNGSVETVWLHPGIKKIDFSALCKIKHLKDFANSNIEEIETFGLGVFGVSELIPDLAVLPQTIRILRRNCFGTSAMPLNKLVIPLSMEEIDGGVYDISGDVYISHMSPFTIEDNAPFGSQSTLKVHVPVDRSATFAATEKWSAYAEKYYEDVTIGPNGYRSYYLENENFEVPTGCTAYIITGVTQRGTSGIGDATVVSFPAGSLIPKKTGFILEGTPNTTIAYRAAVSGTEVNVAGNLLVGTAAEQEFSGAGYKYYLFGKGAQGQGFYHQGTRNGNSMRLGAHHAGLRLPAGSGDFAPIRGFFVDFEAAKQNTVTAISSPTAQTGEAQSAIIYDLQGRRVVSPTRGIYIVNGKKTVIK